MNADYQIRVGVLRAGAHSDKAINYQVAVKISDKDDVDRGPLVYKDIRELDYILRVYTKQMNQEELEAYVLEKTGTIRAKCYEANPILDPQSSPIEVARLESPESSNGTDQSRDGTLGNSAKEEDGAPQSSMEQGGTPENSGKESIQPSKSFTV